MKVIIKKLCLRNFKGIRNAEYEFQGLNIIAKGENRTGKTTLMDAWLWLLTNKDSMGQTDFNIKTIGSDGKPFPRLEHEVSAEIMIDGGTVLLKKIFKEKWTKPRGKNEEVFSGHETEHYFNDVPVSQTEYINKISMAICPGDIFQMLSNPMHFLALPWQQKRKMLFDMAGNISDSDIAKQNPAWMALLNEINGKKTIDEYRKEIAMRKKRCKEEMDVIPARIDEVQRNMPPEEDWAALEASVLFLTNQIKKQDENIMDISRAYDEQIKDYKEIQKELPLKIKKRGEIEDRYTNEVSIKLSAAKAEKAKIIDTIGISLASIKTKECSIEGYQKEITELEKKREFLVAQWHELNMKFAEEPPKEEYVCPACGRPYDEERAEIMRIEAINNHKKNIQSQIEQNVIQGRSVKSQIKILTENLEKAKQEKERIEKGIKVLQTIGLTEIEEQIKILQERYDNISQEYIKDSEYIKLSEEISQIKDFLNTVPPCPNLSEFIDIKESLQKELSEVQLRLSKKERIAEGRKRISELMSQQKLLAEELSANENIEYQIQQFTKAKIDAIESTVNSMFSYIKFKMFNDQVNGGQAETCEATVDGVPYQDVNHAGKINAGLDVINVLSRYYNIFLPVWIDNAEAVNDILPVESQTFKLYVTKDKSLTISSY